MHQQGRQYVIYYRVSSKQQRESGLGIESQRAIVSGFIPQDAIIAEFEEQGSGGAADEKSRPLLHKAIRTANRHGAHLVVAKADRLSRSVVDALTIYEQLGRRLICLDIPNVDKFTLTIFYAIAERELELIRVRNKARAQRMRARGRIIGNPRKLTDRGRRLGAQAHQQQAIDELKHETDLARMWRDEGLGYQAIATKLNQLGLKTRRNGRFHATTVRRMLARAEQA